MARIKKDPPPAAGAPAWMNTYGDMVTLLLTFFILLFSFSTIDAAKWREIVISFTGSSGGMHSDGMPSLIENPGNPDENPETPFDPDATPMPTPGKTLSPEEIQSMADFSEFMEKVRRYVVGENLEDFIEVSLEADQILIRFKDSILFDSGRAEIKPNAVTLLDQIIPIVNEASGTIALIHIEGHTDNRPIGTAVFPSNWELSTGRACSVLRYIIERSSIDRALITASGSGEYRPIDTNDTELGRSNNRRVDIYLNRKRVDSFSETVQ